MFDPTKPVQTRDGRPARIVTTESGDPSYPICAVLVYGSGFVNPYLYRADGSFLNADTPHDADLVNV